MGITQSITKKKVVFLIALLSAVAVFITSAIMLIDRLMPPAQNLDRFKKSSASSGSADTDINEIDVFTNPIDFAALKKVNPDVCGWITVDGTNIDYPILQSGDDKDEDFYLSHDYTGKAKRYGAIFMQKLNSDDFTDKNTVLYGHNMMSGAMFGTLKKFRNKKFFNQNRNIYIYTEDAVRSYEIYAAYTSDNKNILWTYNFNFEIGQQEFIDKFLTEENKGAFIIDGAPVTVDDMLVTLSTCTKEENERYIVVGRLTEIKSTK